MATQTAAPWKVEEYKVDKMFVIGGNLTEHAYAPVKEDAAFIVKACNAHEELLAALKGLLEIGKRDTSNPKYDVFYDRAFEAVARASRP